MEDLNAREKLFVSSEQADFPALVKFRRIILGLQRMGLISAASWLMI
jgi:hypothetical protein